MALLLRVLVILSLLTQHALAWRCTAPCDFSDQGDVKVCCGSCDLANNEPSTPSCSACDDTADVLACCEAESASCCSQGTPDPSERACSPLCMLGCAASNHHPLKQAPSPTQPASHVVDLFKLLALPVTIVAVNESGLHRSAAAHLADGVLFAPWSAACERARLCCWLI